jgi:hypothetical protein
MIVDLLASPAVAGFSVSKIRGQGPSAATPSSRSSTPASRSRGESGESCSPVPASAAKNLLSWADAPKCCSVVSVYTGSFRGVRDQPVTVTRLYSRGRPSLSARICCTFCACLARPRALGHVPLVPRRPAVFGRYVGEPSGGHGVVAIDADINRTSPWRSGTTRPRRARWVRDLAWLKDHLRGTTCASQRPT